MSNDGLSPRVLCASSTNTKLVLHYSACNGEQDLDSLVGVYALNICFIQAVAALRMSRVWRNKEGIDTRVLHCLVNNNSLRVCR